MCFTVEDWNALSCLVCELHESDYRRRFACTGCRLVVGTNGSFPDKQNNMLLPTTTTVTVALTLTLLLGEVVGYKRGPPVDDHPDICGSMSPMDGHGDPLNRSAPFALTIVSSPSGGCYNHESLVTVRLATTNNRTYFEGFFVQARLQSSLNNPLSLESVVLDCTFDPNGDSQLQGLTCGNSTNRNALGHRQAKRYYEKTFTWRPASSFTETIAFVATVVHERDEYWMGVTSPTLRYCEQTVSAAGETALSGTLAFTIAIISGLLMTSRA